MTEDIIALLNLVVLWGWFVWLGTFVPRAWRWPIWIVWIVAGVVRIILLNVW